MARVRLDGNSWPVEQRDITQLVAADHYHFVEPIIGMPVGAAITQAVMTIKLNETDLDADAVAQRIITTTPTEAGYIDAVANIVYFWLNPIHTSPLLVQHYWDLQLSILYNGVTRIVTPLRGNVRALKGITDLGGGGAVGVNDITVTVPPITTLEVGVQASAVAHNNSGGTIAGINFAWSLTADPDIATISETGLITAHQNGPFTVIATAGGVSGTANVTAGGVTNPTTFTELISMLDARVGVDPGAGPIRVAYDLDSGVTLTGDSPPRISAVAPKYVRAGIVGIPNMVQADTVNWGITYDATAKLADRGMASGHIGYVQAAAHAEFNLGYGGSWAKVWVGTMAAGDSLSMDNVAASQHATLQTSGVNFQFRQQTATESNTVNVGPTTQIPSPGLGNAAPRVMVMQYDQPRNRLEIWIDGDRKQWNNANALINSWSSEAFINGFGYFGATGKFAADLWFRSVLSKEQMRLICRYYGDYRGALKLTNGLVAGFGHSFVAGQGSSTFAVSIFGRIAAQTPLGVDVYAFGYPGATFAGMGPNAEYDLGGITGAHRPFANTAIITDTNEFLSGETGRQNQDRFLTTWPSVKQFAPGKKYVWTMAAKAGVTAAILDDMNALRIAEQGANGYTAVDTYNHPFSKKAWVEANTGGDWPDGLHPSDAGTSNVPDAFADDFIAAGAKVL